LKSFTYTDTYDEPVIAYKMNINTDHGKKRSNQAKLLLYQKAIEAEKSDEYKKALEYYRMSLKIDPEFSKSWINAGALYSRLGRPQKAIICYQKAIKSNPESKAYYNLATEYFKSQNYERAKAILFQLLKLDKRFKQAHLLLGYTFGKLNQNKQAETCIKNVLKVDSKDTSALTALSLLYFHDSKMELCRKYSNELLTINANSIIAKRLLANLDIENDLKNSLDLFTDIAEHDPKLKAFSQSVNTNINLEKKREIKTKRNNLSIKKVKSAQDWLDLSLCTLFDGDSEEAMQYLKKAASLKNGSIASNK